MEERSRQNQQFQPFRFWMPSWTSPIGRTCSPTPTRQRSSPCSSSQPSAEEKPMPPMPTSASRRPTTARKGSQQPCKNLPRNRHKIKSPSTMREASKASVQIQPRQAQVKFLSNSQSQLPETKSNRANQAISQADEGQSIASPSPTITLQQHKLQQAQAISVEKDTKQSSISRRSNLRHVTINAMEKTPVDSYSNTSTLPFISTKTTEQINLEKPEPSSQPHNNVSNSNSKSINIKTKVASVSSDANIEQRRSCNEKELKIAISPVSKYSFTDGKRAIYEEEIKEGLSTLKRTISAADSGRGRNNDGSSVNVITLAGKNNGASMVIDYDDTNTESLFHPCKDSSREAVLGSSSINNNVQSINNSAIEQSSCSVRHPGVHLKISNRSSEALASDKAAAKPQITTGRRGFAPLRGQMSSQEPRIRRRCLRALFMESSESDIESSQKPRRHGCRFSCEEKRKMKHDDGQLNVHD